MRIGLVFICLLSVVTVFSQSNPVDIAVVNSFENNQVQLKWYPANIKAWMVGYEHGYDVYRTTVFENGKYISSPERVKLNITPLKLDATKLTETTPNIEEIGMYMVADSLDEELKNTQGLEAVEVGNTATMVLTFTIINLARINQLAQQCGLYWKDEIESNKKYYYEVEIHRKPEFVSSRSWVEFDQPYKIPQPKDFMARVSDKTVTLNWTAKYYNFDFIGYNLYRSEKENGKYERVNDDYITVNQKTLIDNGQTTTYVDSVPNYGQPYYYKLKGVDHFEKESEFSEVQTITAYKKITMPPVGFHYEVTEKSQVKISWNLAEEEKTSVKEVKIYKALDPLSEPFLLATIDPKKSLTYTDVKPLYENYYTLCAVGYGGEAACDFPREAVVRDTIPTGKPYDVTAEVDSNGIATLTWKKPTDPDLMGFILYRNNRKNQEFNKLNQTYITDSVFVDTLNLDLLYSKAYYVISAVDPFYNIAYSDTVELRLPDRHPPIAPQIYFYRSTTDGIVLKWTNSPSEDVVQQVLYRKGEKDVTYRPILEMNGEDLKQKEYVDADTKARTYYSYVILAYDASGLVSDTASELYVEQVMNPIKPKIENITTIVSRENELVKISWEYNQENITRFLVYRAKEAEGLTAYRTVENNQREFLEKSLTPNTSYTYRIVAEFSDGGRSAMSDEVVAKY